MKILVATHDTALKKSVEDTSSPKAPVPIRIEQGTEIEYLAIRPVDAGHEFVTLANNIDGLNSWYIFPGHWEIKDDDAGHLDILMTDMRQTDRYGGRIFNFEMTLDGDRLDIAMGSGVVGAVPTPASQDWPGSGNPIPQGEYEIGATVRESEWQMDPRIGPIWIPLSPQSFSNWRDGFLIHMDYNFQHSPGTLGCPFPQRNRDMYTIAEWNDRAKTGTLRVDYGF